MLLPRAFFSVLQFFLVGFGAANPLMSSGLMRRERRRLTVSEGVYTALSSLYSSTAGSSWFTKTNWMSGDPCTAGWYKVGCSNGDTTSLKTYSNNLIGTIPSEMGYLSKLTDLELRGNSLGSIPSELGTMTGMWTWFDLRNSEHSGSIPSELGAMTGLTGWFSLAHNELTGPIPSQFGAMTGFTSQFEVKDNELSGSIPSELGALTAMTLDVYLNDNELTGSIPSELGAMTGMTDLFYLHSNQLCDDIPSELSALSTQVTNSWDITSGNSVGTSCPTPLPTASPTYTASPTPVAGSADDDRVTADLGAILGGVFGGLAFLCLCIGCTLYHISATKSRQPQDFSAQMSSFQASASPSEAIDPYGPSLTSPSAIPEKNITPVKPVTVPSVPPLMAVATPKASLPSSPNLQMSTLDKGKGQGLALDSSMQVPKRLSYSTLTAATTSHPLMGKRVKICDYDADPKLNNAIGKVTVFDSAAQTFNVELDGFKGTITALREENLQDPFAANLGIW